MSKRTVRIRAGVCMLVLFCLAGLLAVSCSPSFLLAQADTSAVALRIENATASTVDVTIEVLDANGELVSTAPFNAIDIPVVTVTTEAVTYSTLEPIGAAAARASGSSTTGDGEGTVTSGLGAQATVRVSGLAMSEGFLLCGETIKITATIEGEDTSVLLTGNGTGTPGFDEGSVGETGERYLLSGIDFECGNGVVVRIDDDGTTSGATGRVAVVASGEGSPFDPIDDPTGGDTNSNGTASTKVLVQIDNRGSVIANATVLVTTTTGDQSHDVTVPPGDTTEGEFTCGTRLTLSATYPDSDATEGTESLVILTGDGTGSLGFDESSVSPEGERILVVGQHVECGETVFVTLHDDVKPAGFTGIGVLGGTVQVLSAGETPVDDDTGDDTPADAAQDVTIAVDNVTSAFIRVNVVAGTEGVGEEKDIFLPETGESSGTMACSDSYTVTAYSLLPEALTGLLDEVLIVLTGDGTGTENFDSGSVGQLGQRLLLRDVHYTCGATFTVTITDPGEPSYTEPSYVNSNGDITGFNDINGNGIQDEIPDRLGEGTVSID